MDAKWFIAGVLLVLLAGGTVAVFISGGSADLSASITTNNDTVPVDSQYITEVTITNSGSEAGETTLQTRVNGTLIDEQTVSVDAGETETIVITHSFASSDAHAMEVETDEGTVGAWVVDVRSVPESVAASMRDVSTVTMSQTVSGDFESTTPNGTQIHRAELVSTGKYDFDTREFHEHIDEYLYAEYDDGAETRTVVEDRWYTNETLYFTSEVDDGEQTYHQYNGTFDETEQSSVVEIAGFVEGIPDEQVTREDNAYVAEIEYTEPGDIQRVFTALGGVNVFPETAEVTSATAEVRIDANSHTVRSTVLTLDVRGSDPETTVTGNLTVRTEYSGYGEPITVSVPDENWDG